MTVVSKRCFTTVWWWGREREVREGEGYLDSRDSRYTSEMRRQTRSGLAVTASSYMYQGGRCREKCKGDCQDII
ncbi:hypothetical protein PISMIDRAFT_678220, partial [Pisolithus microcarpus 441]